MKYQINDWAKTQGGTYIFHIIQILGAEYSYIVYPDNYKWKCSITQVDKETVRLTSQEITEFKAKIV
jgi:hypothetical protein